MHIALTPLHVKPLEVGDRLYVEDMMALNPEMLQVDRARPRIFYIMTVPLSTPKNSIDRIVFQSPDHSP